MGTRFNLVIPGIDMVDGEKMGTDISEILRLEEQRMSRFDESSEVTKINQNAYKLAHRLSDEMTEILDQCEFYYHATLGAFDPALLSINKIKHPAQPPSVVVQSPADIGWQQVIRNKENKTIRISSPDIGLDLGGFGKGWALKKIVRFLNNKNVNCAFISFGESTITTIGHHPLGKFWETEVPNSFTGRPIRLNLNNESISISGLKTRETEGIQHKTQHIYSPGEGRMVLEDRMVVVKSKDPLRAEILSTALLASTRQQRIAILKRFPDVEVYECKDSDWIKINTTNIKI